jgi:two-component system phosphate regulon sensor histidine kinase PhoR
MDDIISPRGWAAIAIVIITGAILAVIGAGLDTVAVSIVGGIVAVVALMAGGNDSAEPSENISTPTPSAEVDAVLNALAEPILILQGSRVNYANKAARGLLGAHVINEDARTAIRHPAAARLISDHASTATAFLAGLGAPNQRWEMHLAPLDDGRRLVHLSDHSGSHAAERMRVDFVANASHELRTPLASILGYVETLADTAGEDPVTRSRFLKIVFDEARRMDRLVDDLMSLSRIEADKFRAPGESIDLAGLIEKTRAELADAHNGRGKDIVFEQEAEPFVVVGDQAQLSQLLHNLMGNAMKYGRPGTPIRVSLTRVDEMVRLVVADQGEGIPPQHLPRLTERFYRVDPGRSRSIGGTGLGLAIVKHIVERHRGRLEIASQVGEGTRVSVTLRSVSPDVLPIDPPGGTVIKQ